MLFPQIYRLVARAFSRLTPRSRLRRSLVVRRVRRAYAAVNRRDFDLVLVGWDEGSEYLPSRDLMPPDVEPVFHGHDGMRELWRYWLDAFHDLAWEPEELVDFGDALLVSAQQRGTGSGSGVAVSKPVFQVFTLREGLVLRQEDFLQRSDALEAVRRPG